ncbi:MAG: hypothetical protein ISS94_05410 [Candidatus Syntrophoarchaeum sp.]|nr:hypothetical protein [Candidatus Syntrophoarchaeum sp.]
MNRIFILTIIFVFLTIFVESTNLILQLKGRRLTKWFGKNAFNFHMLSTGIFWVITFCLGVILQFEEQAKEFCSTRRIERSGKERRLKVRKRNWIGMNIFL